MKDSEHVSSSQCYLYEMEPSPVACNSGITFCVKWSLLWKWWYVGPPRACSGPDWKIFLTSRQGRTGTGKIGKEHKERPSQDGRWPHVTSTLQITAWLHMWSYRRRQKRMGDKRAPVILTGFSTCRRHWACHSRAWPQNLVPRWQNNWKCPRIFSRTLFSCAVCNETKCRSQT
jgi:hypothetical protein